MLANRRKALTAHNRNRTRGSFRGECNPVSFTRRVFDKKDLSGERQQCDDNLTNVHGSIKKGAAITTMEKVTVKL
jgi:hypothetical protein